MTNNILIAGQLKKNNLSKKENVSNLVRILARFGNIPKIDGINIISSKKESDLYKIIPGESIIIGSTYLENPVLALIYLRYGIEWQIWFKANDKDISATFLYDSAALRVTSMFFDLLPKQDKNQIKGENYLLTDYILEKGSVEVDFLNKDAIAVMAVDNLPNELPKDASVGFSDSFVEYVIPAFFNGDKDGVLERARMTKDGELTEKFSYLQNFVDGE